MLDRVAATRVYSHGSGDRTADDPQILAVVGRVRGNAHAAGGLVLKAAEAVQRAADAVQAGGREAAEPVTALADVEVNQAVTVVTNLVLEATTVLFDALGAFAVNGTRPPREYRVGTAGGPPRKPDPIGFSPAGPRGADRSG